MWDECGMARSADGLKKAIADIRALREEFYKDVRVPGQREGLNIELDKAARVADFLELGELMCLDALTREESCGGHFRTEYQSPDGEALRDDANFTHVAVWEHQDGDPGKSVRHQEELNYEYVKLITRSYK
jgi:succinate dehydrogenase / fumarate reductase flavoprotein subunit